jgi:hypothetical protein
VLDHLCYALGGEVVNFKQIVQHEKYNSDTVDFDFSLLELTKNLTLGKNKKIVALPKQNEAVKDGALCQVSFSVN